MLIRSLLVILLLLAAVPSDATVLWSSNWDTGTPDACWPCKSLDGTCNFNSWYQPGYIDSGFYQFTTSPKSGVSTTKSHSGASSYYQYRKSGEAATCDIYYSLSNLTTVYIRFYIYLDDGWTSTYGQQQNFLVHFLFTNTAAASTGFRLNIVSSGSDGGNGNWGDCTPLGALCILPEGHGGRQWWSDVTPSRVTSGTWGKGTNLVSLAGAWHCFEYKLEIGSWNATFSAYDVSVTEWIDGVQTRGPTTGAGSNTDSFSKIIISGWDNLSSAQANGFYIDDIVIADAYIGPLSEEPAPSRKLNNVTGVRVTLH